MKRRWIACSAAILLAAAGCGGKEVTSSMPEASSVVSKTAATTETTQSESTQVVSENMSTANTTGTTGFSSQATRKPATATTTTSVKTTAPQNTDQPKNKLKVVIHQKTALKVTEEKRPNFSRSVPGAWTELPPFVLKVGSGYKAIITTKLSGIYDLNPGKTIFQRDAFDTANGKMITAPAYVDIETGKQIAPDKVPDGPYWRRNYGSVFGTFQNGGNLYAVIHGENKNEIVDGVKYKNNVEPLTKTYGPDDYSGKGDDGIYRDAWKHYFNFLNIQWTPIDQLHTTGSLLKHDEGPIIWPTDGYIFEFDGEAHQACDGLRHPSVIVDGGYIYVYYLDSSSSNFGMHVARAPLSSNGMPGSFKKYYNGSFSQPALPDGFDKNDPQFLRKGSGRSTPVIECENPVRFSVARPNGTPYQISVQEEIADGKNTILLRASKDFIHWSDPVEIPGIAVEGWHDGNLHDPLIYSKDFSSSTDVDASEFYIVGTSMAADSQGWPITQYMKINLSVTE